MTPIRTPYWLTQSDRAAAQAAIEALLDTTTVLPSLHRMLDALLTELGVVEARDQVWPQKTEIARLAQGRAADALPIRMSSEELTALLALPALPQALRSRLAGQSEKK